MKNEHSELFLKYAYKLDCLDSLIKYFMENHEKDNLVTPGEYLEYYYNNSIKGKIIKKVKEAFKDSGCISRVTVLHSFTGTIHVDLNSLENVDEHSNPDLKAAKEFFTYKGYRFNYISLKNDIELYEERLENATSERAAKRIIKEAESTLLQRYLYFYHV